MERVIIVGGGIAGLTCLNALLDQGVSALLLEAGTIGEPKMCGEFLAPPAVSFLKQWDIGPIQTIQQVNFFTKNKTLTVDFPKPAGALARDQAELQLAERAKQKGGQILENSPILNMVPDTQTSSYTFCLESGEKIQAQSTFMATGKMNPIRKSVKLPYYALKTHFKNVINPNTLLMHSVKNAYFGVVPISDEFSNFACLVKKEAVDKAGSCRQFFYDLVRQHKFLQQTFEHMDISKIDLLEGKSPKFCLKNIPDWPNVFWVGDALASFPPAIGYGFTHSIHSAVIAVKYFLKNDPIQYHQISKKTIKPNLLLGRGIHQLLLNPVYGSLFFPFLQDNPWISNLLLRKIGYNK